MFTQGKVSVPGDIPYYDSFFLQEPYARLKTPLNLSVSDQIEQFYVWRKIAANSMQQDGHIPLWNPYEFAGQPLVANAQSALFYPPNLLLFFLSPAKVATISKMLILLVSGIFTFLFCRSLRISDTGSFLGTVAFTFSGPLITFLGHPHANVLACFPAMMWAGEKLLQHDRLSSCAILGLAMGISILGGHPETTFYCWVVLALYVAARAFFDRSVTEKGRIFLSFLLAAGIGVLLGGIQLLPFTEALLHSATLNYGRSIAEAVEKTNPLAGREFLNNLPQAITLICPNFFGNPVDWSYYWPFASLQSYSDRAIYFGTIPLALAAGALFTVPKRQPLTVISLLALFCIGVAWHFPLLEAVNQLPIFSKGISLRLTFQFNFLVAVMAAMGVDALRNNLSSPRPDRLFSGLTAGCLLATLLASLLIAVGHIPSVAMALPSRLAAYLPPLEPRTFLPAAIASAALLAYLTLAKSSRGHTIVLRAVAILTVMELLGFAWGYNPAVPEKVILPETAPIRLMQTRAEGAPFRILRTDEILHANYGAVYGLADISGYDAPIDQRYEDLYRALGGKPVRDRQYWSPDWPLIDFLNVKYILTNNTLDTNRFSPVYQTGSYKIYENRHVLPRAFIVFENEVIDNDRKILERLADPGYDFGSKVILEEAPQLQFGGSANGTAASSVKFIKHSTDEVMMEISCDRPGIMVMSDLYTTGWKAFIDKAPTKIYRANYAFRALVIPAGKHSVAFRYSPGSFRIGAAMTLGGIVVILAIIIMKKRAGYNRETAIQQ